MAAQFCKHPFLLTAEEAADALRTDLDRGLTSAQVESLQHTYPRNELDAGGAISWHRILAKQVLNAMILILTMAMALSFGIKDWIEGGVLAAVIILNVTIGFWQEFRAEKRMDALRTLSSPSAMVLRDGKAQVIANPEVVPGDIVILKMGDTVPADLRLFEAMNLACQEAQLTGESIAVDKSIDNDIAGPGSEKTAERDDEVSIGDRVNMAYATTVVQKGRGRGIVTATGMATEVGMIAASTTQKPRKAGRSMNWRKYGKAQPVVGLTKRTYDLLGKFLGLTEGTPLQKKLSALAYALFAVAFVLAIIVFAVNHFDLRNEVILYAVSLGIAIVPESLVAVLTVTMVVAVTVMRKHNVVVRDLSALEALGGVTHICSDKTGTLTEGAMIVREAWLPSSRHRYTVHDSPNANDPTRGRVTCSRALGEDEKPPPAVEGPTSGASPASRARREPAVSFSAAPPAEAAVDLSGPVEEDELHAFLVSAALCNVATVRFDRDEQQWQTTGEPTEVALQVWAQRFRLDRKTLEREGWRQLAEFPFDSSIKRMSTVFDPPADAQRPPGKDGSGNSVVFTKGAVERLLDLCAFVGVGEDRRALTEADRQLVLDKTRELASQGQRVLAVACRRWGGAWRLRRPGGRAEDEGRLRRLVERALVLVGIAAIYDPPRRETRAAIAECARAGIRVHMVTGDHPETARAIAQAVGIVPRGLDGPLMRGGRSTAVMKATELDRLSEAEMDALPELPLVIARCAPETKTRVILGLRRRGALMAMTGDGVNDAPSLSRADVGIAMGSGSDVAKGAATMVLADDKFNSIVAAIREGRRMFDNIQKFVLHLLATNVGEVILLVVGLAFVDRSGFSVYPISPLQVLWINMITSSFPAFGLGREEAAADVMTRPPRDRRRGVFTNQLLADMFVYGLLMGACTLATFAVVVHGVHGGELGEDCNNHFSATCEPVFRARAATFAELTWLILFAAWEFKSLRRSLFCVDPSDSHRGHAVFRHLYRNRFLFWSVIAGALSVFPVVYVPFINHRFFKHTAISWEWGLSLGFLLVFVAGVELWKLAKRRLGLLEDKTPQPVGWAPGQGRGQSQSLGSQDLPRPQNATTLSSFKTWASSSLRSRLESERRGSDSVV